MAAPIPMPQSPLPAFAMGPGMVTSNVTGSTYQNMTPEGERRMYELEDERKRKREAANANIMAQRAAQQRAAQDEANRGRVREAFNAMYGPQMQRSYHDRMVMSEGVKGTNVPKRYGQPLTGNSGQSRLSSGNLDPNNPNWTPEGGWYKLDQTKLNTMLDNMWRMNTDPYMRAAGRMGSSFLPTMPGGSIGGSAPSARAAWVAKYGSGGRGGRMRKEEEEEKGIDWQKSSGGGPGAFQYELFGGG